MTKPTKRVCAQQWWESPLCTQWVAKDPMFLYADSKDSNQTGRKPRLIWVFAGRTLILLVLSCHGSKALLPFDTKPYKKRATSEQPPITKPDKRKSYLKRLGNTSDIRRIPITLSGPSINKRSMADRLGLYCYSNIFVCNTTCSTYCTIQVILYHVTSNS